MDVDRPAVNSLGLSPTRPYLFLITTPLTAQSTREHLGSPAYSYGFVVDALKPILDRLGTTMVVERPESRLSFAAAEARSRGLTPVQLAISPLNEVYLTPDVPTIVFPFWEFPRIPDRDFGQDTRQNWSRVARHADMILSACRFTADSFRRSRGVATPVAVVPVPLDASAFSVPEWTPEFSWTIKCRHVRLGPESQQELTEGTVTTETRCTSSRTSPRGWLRSVAQRGYHRIYPYLDPASHRRIARLRDVMRHLSQHSPLKLSYLMIRTSYKRLIRPWLSDMAIRRVTSAKERLLSWAGVSSTDLIDPLCPSGDLTLKGLVYTSLFNLGDIRKNFHDLITSFICAFRDRSDVTLVLKLATNPRREFHEVNVLRSWHQSLGIRHRCRIVVITEYLNDDQMRSLLRASTYYVNASFAEGACLPLQQALASGRPAIAPDHTAMADYVDSSVAFVIRSHTEPTHWPHDPERRIETSRYRPVWADLRDHFTTSALVAEQQPARYIAMSEAARRRMEAVASREVAEAALREALKTLSQGNVGTLPAHDWAPIPQPELEAA